MIRALLRSVAIAVFAIHLCNVLAIEPVKIAFLGGLSGPYALQEEEAYKVATMMADIVNSRGGVLGGQARGMGYMVPKKS